METESKRLKIENSTFAYVGAFVDELARSGVKNVVVCPGSRSTPLAYGFAGNPAIRLWMGYDERSAGFFALGIAKASQSPVALVCTSGTAAANFMPAVVEAFQSHLPLIVLTADRPAELRDNGAPQAIDQNRLYGNYAKWFMDTALPEASNEMLRYIRTVACRAAGTALATPAGPVHLNMPFREPLTPAPIPGQPLPPLASRDPVAWYGRINGQPYVQMEAAPRELNPTLAADLMSYLATAERGLIICGPQDDPQLATSLTALAAGLGWPVLADPLSQLRAGPHDHSLIISNYDAFLRDERFTNGDEFRPEVVLRFGAMPTAKPLLLFLKRFLDVPQIVVDGNYGWPEPTGLAERLVQANPVALCSTMLESLQRLNLEKLYESSPPSETAWLTAWLTVGQRTAQALTDRMQEFEDLFEGRVLATMADRLPAHSTLFVGNSMPVRDLDSFFGGSDQPIRVLANRGANGIDGVISTALGVAAVSEGPTVLVLGDLSAYHDMNGLLAAKLHRLNATIIVLNNDGGGIFSFLPQAGYTDNFEQLFGTPHGLNFEAAARMYSGDYHLVTNWADFEATFEKALTQDGLKLIEVPTNRATNVIMHRQMWAAVYDSLATTVVH